MFISKSLFRCVAVLGLISVMLIASPGISFGQPFLGDSNFNASAVVNPSNPSAALRANEGVGNWYESRADGTSGPLLLTLDTVTVGSNATHKAKLASSTNFNTYLTQQFGTPQTGVFAVQWDIYMDTILSVSGYPDRAGWMLIGDSTDPTRTGPNSDDPERFVYMAFYKNGGGTSGPMDLVARDRDDTWDLFTTVATGLQMKQWHTIKVVCNIPGGTYQVYVDGTSRGTVTSRQVKTQVTHISFASWDPEGAGTFYVDNVRRVASTCTGDISEDGDRDGADLASFIAAYGTTQGQTAYNPLADMDGDNDVALDDLAIFAGLFGHSCP